VDIKGGGEVIALVALLGLLVGAGLNHLADRLPGHERIDPSPRCDHCAMPRSLVSWVSTLAFVIGRHRCLSCAAPVSVRHPIVELATAALFASLYQSRGLTLYFLLGAFYACVFLMVLITDLEHRLILNAVIVPAMVVALVGSLLPEHPSPESAVIGGAIGFGFFLLVSLLRPGAMGAGDVKLAAFIGIATGFPTVITALLIGIFTGGFVALVLVALRVKSMKSYIPYGPFLVFGGGLVIFWGPLIKRWLMMP
jgi:prepilin signal peptidase PulO-like enzyme (type II secretory pathway)